MATKAVPVVCTKLEGLDGISLLNSIHFTVLADYCMSCLIRFLLNTYDVVERDAPPCKIRKQAGT